MPAGDEPARSSVVLERRGVSGWIVVVTAVSVLVVAAVVLRATSADAPPTSAAATSTTAVRVTPGSTLAPSSGASGVAAVAPEPGAWPHEPAVTDGGIVTGIAAIDGGYVAIGGSAYNRLTFWRHVGGHADITYTGGFRSWSLRKVVSEGPLVAVTGSVTTIDDGLAQVGVNPPGRPIVWLSRDAGQTWTEHLDVGLSDGGADDVVITAGRVFAVVHAPRAPATVVVSTEDGTTWTTLDSTDFGGDVDHLAVVGNVLAALVHDGDRWWVARGGVRTGWSRSAVLPDTGGTSIDGVVGTSTHLMVWGQDDRTQHGVLWNSSDGATWARMPVDAKAFGGDGVARLSDVVAWNDELVAVASARVQSDLQFCFQDLSTCRRDIDRVAASTDGVHWYSTTLRVDRTARAQGSPEQLLRIAPGTRLLVLSERQSIEDPHNLVYQWIDPVAPSTDVDFPSGLPLNQPLIPTTSTPAHPALPDRDRSASDRVLEVGVVWRYEYGLIPNCPLEDFNGRKWTNTSSRFHYPYPATWPITSDRRYPIVYGTIELVDPDHIEIGVEGVGPVWTYTATDTLPGTSEPCA